MSVPGRPSTVMTGPDTSKFHPHQDWGLGESHTLDFFFSKSRSLSEPGPLQQSDK